MESSGFLLRKFTGRLILILSWLLFIDSVSGQFLILTPPHVESVGPHHADIAWETDVPLSGLLLYGQSTELGDTLSVTASTTHAVGISGLASGTVYWYAVAFPSGGGYGLDELRSFVTLSDPSSTGEIRPLFSGSVKTELASSVPASGGRDLMDDLVNRIDSARYSIDACFTRLDHWMMRDALIAAWKRGVAVRVICDNEYETKNNTQDLLQTGIPVIGDDYKSNPGTGSMHDKFAVFDHRDSLSFSDDWVWTGSFNPEPYDGSPMTLNNVVLIQDQALAELFTREFEVMWGGAGNSPSRASLFGQAKPWSPPLSMTVNGKRVDAWFGPQQPLTDALTGAIDSADRSLYFSIFSFTRGDLADRFAQRLSNVPGLIIRGVFDTDQWIEAGSKSELGTMSRLGRVWLDAEPGKLHHKYLLADADDPSSDPLVATGSYNWENDAAVENDENLIVIHDAVTSNQYLQEFAARFETADGSPWDEVKSRKGIVPESIELSPVYPNPFNSETVARFYCPRNEIVRIEVYDVSGRMVRNLLSERIVGSGEIRWDGTDSQGISAPSGIYYIRFSVPGASLTRKAVLVR